MRRRPRLIECLVLLSIAAVLATLGHDEWRARCGTRDGLIDAERDIESGNLQWKLGGKRQHSDSIAERLARERYGIPLSRAYECCATTYLWHYTQAYNDRVARHIAQTFPAFSMTDLFADARNEHAATASN